jgi:hypothetical protein
MSKNPMITLIVVALVAGLVGGGIGFAAGKMPQFSGASLAANGSAGQFAGTGTAANGQSRGNLRMMGNSQSGTGTNGAGNFMRNGASGQISSIDATSLTVKMADGSSRIVLFSDKTTYENTTKATKDDLKTGAQVRVIGTANADGSVTAANVTLNPAMFVPNGESPAPTQRQTPGQSAGQ